MNKCRSEITTQLKRNNLDHMIDPKFRNFSSLLVLSFQNSIIDPTSDSLGGRYMSLVEMKYFNASIINKEFFNQPVKNKLEAY